WASARQISHSEESIEESEPETSGDKHFDLDDESDEEEGAEEDEEEESGLSEGAEA
ncbi:MAG: hypothetical protein M1824_003572, partial [Vezdaea acicularis]